MEIGLKASIFNKVKKKHKPFSSERPRALIASFGKLSLLAHQTTNSTLNLFREDRRRAALKEA